MSATNTTTNYNLPIFIETDKPAWLVDFNGAMRAIDAQMKTNADAIATKSPILTFNDTAEIDFTKSGDIITANLASGVSDKVGRALVTPISAPASEQLVGINTNGAQENLEIGSGLKVTSGALHAIDLTLTNKTTVTTLPGLPSGITILNGSLTAALNADKSAGKIYGAFEFRSTASAGTIINIDTGLTVDPPDTQYDIYPVGIGFRSGSDNLVRYVSYSVHTDGHVYMAVSIPGNGNTYFIFFPCVYFFSDFGDTPAPTP